MRLSDMMSCNLGLEHKFRLYQASWILGFHDKRIPNVAETGS